MGHGNAGEENFTLRRKARSEIPVVQTIMVRYRAPQA